MEFLSVKELSESPEQFFSRLVPGGKVVVTSKGQPQALMFKIDAANFEKTLALVQQLELNEALNSMQRESAGNGNARMTLDEINAEISAARTEMAAE